MFFRYIHFVWIGRMKNSVLTDLIFISPFPKFKLFAYDLLLSFPCKKVKVIRKYEAQWNGIRFSATYLDRSNLAKSKKYIFSVI